MHSRRHRPCHDIGKTVFPDEGSEFLNAMIDGADDPGLRNTFFLHDPGDASMTASRLAEPAVDLHPPALPGPDDRPVAVRVIGDQARPDDPDPIPRRIAARPG